MQKLKWGIISTGRIAEWFCGDFHEVVDGELYAVASRSRTAASSFAEQFNIRHAYDDYHEMIENPAIDVVYIGTPHTVHFENAAAALRAGKAVLCEKPMTVGARECEDLIRIAEETGGYMMEAMWSYFLPAMRKAKEWVAEGRIGEIISVKTDFGYPVAYEATLREYDAALGGGCLLEMGIYPAAIARYFTERDPIDMHAIGRHAPNGVEDDVTAIFDYGDASASIGVSYRARLRNAAHIIGTDGYIVLPNAFRATDCALFQIDEQIDQFSVPRLTRGYEYQAIAVCEDLKAGRKQSDIMPLEASLAFQKTIDQIKSKIS